MHATRQRQPKVEPATITTTSGPSESWMGGIPTLPGGGGGCIDGLTPEATTVVAGCVTGCVPDASCRCAGSFMFNGGGFGGGNRCRGSGGGANGGFLRALVILQQWLLEQPIVPKPHAAGLPRKPILQQLPRLPQKSHAPCVDLHASQHSSSACSRYFMFPQNQRQPRAPARSALFTS